MSNEVGRVKSVFLKPGTKPGKPGDRRDVFPFFLTSYRSNGSPPCLSSAAVAGRPPFRGTKCRCVDSSTAAINSGDPSGRPVCVHCRSSAKSPCDSSEDKYLRHPETVQRFRHSCMSNKPSAFSVPQCTAALDQFHSCGSVTNPARTGFRSL